MNAFDLRQRARNSLSGQWGNAVLVSFVASLLGVANMFAGNGGSSISGTISSNLSSLLSGSSESAGYDSYFYEYGNAEAYSELISSLAAVFFTILGVALLICIALFIISGACRLGYVSYHLQVVDGKYPRFSVLFSQIRRIGSGIAMEFLVWLYTVLWSLLFIIPGIIKSYSYSMTAFILAENPDLSVNEAITRSRYLMDGNKWRLFCLTFSFIGWELLCLAPVTLGCILSLTSINAAFILSEAAAVVLLILAILLLIASPVAILVGKLFLTPYQNTAIAAFYRQICAEKDRPMIGEIEY